MKKLLLLLLAVILSSVSVIADTGIVVDFPDRTEQDCIPSENSMKASAAIDDSKFVPTWSGQSAFGRLLCGLDGEGEDVAGNFCEFNGNYWAFYVNEGSGWEFASEGLDSYDAKDGTLLGLVFGDGTNEPSGMSFGDVCRTYLLIDRVRVEIDGDSETLSPGETLKVNPGAEINFEVSIENPEEDLQFRQKMDDVEVEVIIDGLGISEEDGISSLDSGDSEKANIDVEIDEREKEDDYELIVKVTGFGEDKKKYVKTMSFTIDIEKKDHDLRIRNLEYVDRNLECNASRTFSVEVENMGSKKERNAELVISSVSAGYSSTIPITGMDEEDEDKFTDTVAFSRSLKSNDYVLRFEVFDSDGKLNDEKSLTVKYRGCSAEAAAVVQEVAVEPLELINQPAHIIEYPEVEELHEDALSNKYVLGLVIAAYAVVMLLGVILVFKFSRKLY